MTDRNPPQEREAKTIRPDQLHEWLKSQLAQVIARAERYRGIRLAQRLDLRDEFEEEATCCVGGRSTREIPCMNRRYPGCPFRDRHTDHDLTFERTRGFDR
jgi:hypothetical protein